MKKAKQINKSVDISKRYYNILIACFLGCFIIFPCLTIFGRTESLIPSVVLFFIFILAISWKNIYFLDNKKTIYFILGAGLLLRILIVIFLNKQMIQISDFYQVYASGSAFSFKSFYYQSAYHYLLYTMLNGILYKVFGAYQLVSFFLNVFATTLASVFLYLSAKKVFRNETIANITAILFTFWPSMLLYNTILFL